MAEQVDPHRRVNIHHDGIDADATVPASALEHYKAAGWKPADTDARKVAAELKKES
jgi:hypothetical protein